MLGGLIVGTFDLGLDPQFYIQKVMTTIFRADYFQASARRSFLPIFIAITAVTTAFAFREALEGGFWRPQSQL